ncbi:MAG: NAD/NADP octopine/nopaline dehydrogenase family protein [Bacteroidales bacterium]|nr:NAD/NADP octopine/nopaline dehydrogenase family protein [Bacteroidales bacterium]
MRVCIVGGGHIGTALMCYVKHTHPEYIVTMYTRRPELFSKDIKCNDWENNLSYVVTPDAISNDASIAVKEADLVFIALPHFAIEKAFADIAPYVSDSAFIGVIPGGGGCEFIFPKYFNSNKTLFGFQRVPFTAKLENYGAEANLKSWKPFSVVGALPSCRIDEACDLINACGLKTQKATNYLEVALTPTNPILHTSRTNELFGGHDRNYIYPEKSKFYVGWSDKASTTLFGMDSELQTLLSKITLTTGLKTEAIRPLSEHYESPTIEALTAKINGIPTFQSVFAPMKEVDGGYLADTTSRMFTEDFPWGLAVIRSYFDLFGIPAPTMDKVLGWYANYMGLEWYVDGKFCGKDLNVTGVLGRYGIKSINELIEIYK